MPVRSWVQLKTSLRIMRILARLCLRLSNSCSRVLMSLQLCFSSTTEKARPMGCLTISWTSRTRPINYKRSHTVPWYDPQLSYYQSLLTQPAYGQRKLWKYLRLSVSPSSMILYPKASSTSWFLRAPRFPALPVLTEPILSMPITKNLWTTSLLRNLSYHCSS